MISCKILRTAGKIIIYIHNRKKAVKTEKEYLYARVKYWEWIFLWSGSWQSLFLDFAEIFLGFKGKRLGILQGIMAFLCL